MSKRTMKSLRSLINVTIDSTSKRDSFTFAFIALKAEKQVSGKNLVDITSIYLSGYEGAAFSSEEEETEFLRNAIEVSVWPRFRDLFEIIASQAELDFPRLPARPDEIVRSAPAESK